MKTSVSLSEYAATVDELDQTLVKLFARQYITDYEITTPLRKFDERCGWMKWGFDSCAKWLHWRCDLSLSASRERVRVAHAVRDLSVVSAAFSKGVLSYSKVRALTRVATPENEASLVDFAMTTTAHRVEERCRQMRNVEPGSVAQANRAHENRSLQVWRNPERGTMTLTLEVPIEDGEVIDQALSKARENNTSNGPEFASVSFSAQQADALVSMARESLRGNAESGSSSADAYQVVVHVDESALTRGEGRSDLPIETVKRLCCDTSTVRMIENSDGQPLNVGRKQRTVSTAIRRALLARDGGCVYPGCVHTRFLAAHHVRHWADGGETSLENTLILCDSHHRLVHEGGYEIRKDFQGHWYFRRSDGRAIPRCGYHPDDMIDDDIGESGASAEGSVTVPAVRSQRIRKC